MQGEVFPESKEESQPGLMKKPHLKSIYNCLTLPGPFLRLAQKQIKDHSHSRAPARWPVVASSYIFLARMKCPPAPDHPDAQKGNYSNLGSCHLSIRMSDDFSIMAFCVWLVWWPPSWTTFPGICPLGNPPTWTRSLTTWLALATESVVSTLQAKAW